MFPARAVRDHSIRKRFLRFPFPALTSIHLQQRNETLRERGLGGWPSSRDEYERGGWFIRGTASSPSVHQRTEKIYWGTSCRDCFFFFQMTTFHVNYRSSYGASIAFQILRSVRSRLAERRCSFIFRPRFVNSH